MNSTTASSTACALPGRQRFIFIAGVACSLAHSAFAGEPGKLTREVWLNVPGGQLEEFTFSPRSWQAADSVSTFAGAVAPSDTVDNFAARIRGYVTAPVSGEYTFWIASDDDSELYLSTGDSKFNRVKIASLSGFVSPQAWDVKPTQKSVFVTLEAGHKYFIEALQKDGLYGDHLALAWQVPGADRELIPASALESYSTDSNDVDKDELPDDWETAHGFSLTDNGTVHPEQHPLADADQDGLTNLENSGFPYSPVRAAGPGTGEPGKMTREFWYEIPGGELSHFTTSPRYWQPADSVTTFPGSAAPMDTDNNFAVRIRAYVTPTVSGEYTFWIASDDDSELYLSTDDSKFHRVKIASLTGYVNPLDWDAKASQKSALIPMVAGQHYFIEALHKDGIGGDHCAIAWQAPGGTRELIPAASLESFTIDANDRDNDELPDNWELANGFDIHDKGFLNPAGHPLADPDHDGVTNLQESVFGTSPGSITGSVAANFGRMTREVWLNIPGDQLTDFTLNARYWQQPDSVSTFPGAAAPSDVADDFASRIRGFVTAPVTGNYTFWIASDDSSQLELSTDRSKFNRVKIASLNGWTQPREWTKYQTQQSQQIPLVAGRSYFIEALLKEGRYGDHLEIAWQVPGGVRELIPPHALEAYAEDANDADHDELPDDWEQANGFSIVGSGSQFPDQHPMADPDQDGYSNLEESQFGTDPRERGGIPGSLLVETWNGIPGAELPYLIWNRRFYQNPDKAEFTFSAEVPQNRAEDFGARMRGYVIAPVSGDYTFYVAGDDGCELWLSTGENQFAKEKIAFNGTWTNPYEWTKFESQKSKVIPLVAGKKYYIEALMKEAIYGDHLAVAWTTPGSNQISVIPGAHLESYAYAARDPDGDNMPENWEENHGLDPTINDAALDPDSDGIPNALEYAGRSNPKEKNRFTGALLHELWWNVPSFSIRSDITARRMLEPPDEVSLALDTRGKADFGDSYADRYRGYLTAPVSGTYTFWAVGDEEVELWLSTSENKFKKELIVHPIPQIRDFDGDLSMKSRAITLEAGQRYYLEILHVDHHGWDFCDVAWQAPGGQREIIPSSALTSYVPVANDRDDDNLPDDWEVANGLDPNDNGWINPVNGAHGDLDGDGLDNTAERQARTRADLADTDGDGVSDSDELEVLETKALVADAAPFQPVVVLDGSSYTADSGEWFADQACAVQGTSRGWVEYNLTLQAAGVYQAEFKVSPSVLGPSTADIELVVDVDGIRMGRIPVHLSAGNTASAMILTPWLEPGIHKFRIFVDNTVTSRRVAVRSVTVSASCGADANGNGVPDWVDVRLATGNTVQSPSESLVSPVCIGGKARWSGLVAVNGATVQSAPDQHWYADIPLDSSKPTVVDVSMENQGRILKRKVRWIATNLLKTQNLVIRQGDSLKLSAFSGLNPGSEEIVTLAVEGQIFNFRADQPLTYRFINSGLVPVQVTHVLDGFSTQMTATVDVVAPPLLSSPVCVSGHWREWDLPPLPAGAVIDLEPALTGGFVPLGETGSRMLIRLETPDDQPALVRLWSGGPVLSSTALRGMKVRSGTETSMTTLETNAGISRVAMPVVIDGIWPDTEVRIEIFIGGVTFSDGTLTRAILLPQDCDAFGTVMIEFLKAGNIGSSCHRVSVWQNGKRIAWKQ